MASFDAKRVTPLEWAGIGAGALAFIASFLPWYSIDLGEGNSFAEAFGVDTSANAWSFFGGLFPVLLLMAAAVVVLLPHFGTPIPNLALIWLGLSAAAFVIIVLRWVTFDSGPGFGASAGASFGLFIGLLAALVSAVAAFLVYRASSRTTTR